YEGKEIAGEGDKTAQEDQGDASPEEISKGDCVTCHGEDYEGVSGPKLKGFGDRMDTAAIKEKIEKGGNGMPGGLVPPEKL
ncbi:cytochrome c, partial [Bacillus sp. GbtcB13]|uniref:c-type cytochrome n=1 Tax=Bacillus sp. GbtcB13 TaxID=2824758 RepID=UPI001C308EE1